MAKRAAFALPKGVGIELTDTLMSVTHDGDILLEDTLGRSLERVESAGDVTLRLETITGTIVAGGTLTIEGNVDAASLRASKIVLKSKTVAAKAISASESIQIGPASLTVEAIVAPTINIDSKASGRVTVIDSQNDRAPTKIKGGFSLSDYDDMIGNATEFLAERGIPAPDGAAAPAPDPVEEPPVEEAPVEEPPTEDEAEEEEVVLAPTPAAPIDDDEDIDDPLSLSLEDLEPLNDSEEDQQVAVQARLQDALRRITACYDGGSDTPPAVSELRSLVEDGDVDALSQNITSVWNGLLGFHQKRGIRPHHQVTHAFNVIHSLVS